MSQIGARDPLTGRYVKADRDDHGQMISYIPIFQQPSMGREIKLLLSAATPDCARLLIKVVNDVNQDIKLRVQCAESILDRIVGKPKLAIEADIRSDTTHTIDLSGLSMDQLIVLAGEGNIVNTPIEVV